MPINNFSDNVARWLSIADLKIDYYTQFIKSWIPFNAWYMVSFYDESISRTSDRTIIDHIKNSSNIFRDRIKNLLQGDNQESIQFKNNLALLHIALEGHSVPNSDERLSFSSLNLAINTQQSHVISYMKFDYKVTYNRNLPRGTKRLKCEIFDTKRANACIYIDELFEWSKQELQNSPQYQSLPHIRKEKIRLCFEEVNPKKPEDIVIKPQRNSRNEYVRPTRCIILNENSNIYFIDDYDIVSKMVIEMLYRLRCVLFHGELNPTETNQEIYEYAYYVQKTLINELR